MKKKTFIMICLTVIFGMVLGPLQSVAAAEATWPSGIYPPPATGSFTSLNGVFDRVSTDSSMIMNGADEVGIELNPDATNQAGSMWSKNPIVDLTKSFKLEMPMFFGNNTISGADGKTFALAGTRPSAKGNSGPSLGAWGGQGGIGLKPENIAAQGLQNSFVVAIDTHKDDMDQNADYPGLNPNQQYIGSGYPGQASMYAIGLPLYKTQLKFTPTTQEPLQKFSDNIKDNVSNNLWHNLTVSWTTRPTGGTLNYQLTYRSGSGSKTTPSRSITWTKDQIKQIFGTDKVYLGFTSGTTSGLVLKYKEPHVLGIKSLADFNTVKGTVTLKRGNDNVTETTRLNIGDKLTYDYALDINNLDGRPWPATKIVLPKGEHLEYLKEDGTAAKAGDTLKIQVMIGSTTQTVDAVVQSDNLSAVISSDKLVLPKNTDSIVKFSLPAQVASHDLVSDQAVTDGAGTLTGGTPVKDYKLINTVDQTNNVKYVIAANPGELTLEKVPGFYFEKLGVSGLEDPTVADVINGIPGQNPFPVTSAGIDPTQWLNTLGRKTPAGYDGFISVKDSRPTKPGWTLSMKLSPFTRTEGGYVLGDNGNTDGGKAQIVLIDTNPQAQLKVASIKDNGNDTVVKSMPAGNSDWDLKDDSSTAPITQALMSIEKTPSVHGGKYSSTATWTLANAPQ